MTVDEMKSLVQEWRRLPNRPYVIGVDERATDSERARAIRSQLNSVGLDIFIGDFEETLVTIQSFQSPSISKPPRDTQFAGFAQSVVDELFSLEVLSDLGYTSHDLHNRGVIPMRTIIAQRAYDFVLHVIHAVNINPFQVTQPTPFIACVSDLPELPVFPEEEQQGGQQC